MSGASGASGRSWSESATWRVQTRGSVEEATRFVDVLPLQQQLDELLEPLPCFT